ncbi:hypothetical protein QTO34_017055 [Cnephaeus nilssonii]|uniref:Uncharacterized protein n=1 Tax=Cnephaeus nilssonii TaxID=3371016 RepID=A0AA40LPI4_CNENI|nr:hypothetical protein QTO34_017055 [Eptesicus nilssonii]
MNPDPSCAIWHCPPHQLPGHELVPCRRCLALPAGPPPSPMNPYPRKQAMVLPALPYCWHWLPPGNWDPGCFAPANARHLEPGLLHSSRHHTPGLGCFTRPPHPPPRGHALSCAVATWSMPPPMVESEEDRPGTKDQCCRHLNVSKQREKRPSRPVRGGFAFKTKWVVWSCTALTSMAVSVSAVRLWLGVWGVRVMQAGGFGCEQSTNLSSEAGMIREAEQTKEQLAALKKQHEEEITHHKKEIECLQKEIEWHKQNIKKLKDHDTAAVSGCPQQKVNESSAGARLGGMFYKPNLTAHMPATSVNATESDHSPSTSMAMSSQYHKLLSDYGPPSLGYTQGTGNSQVPQSKYAELLIIIHH